MWSRVEPEVRECGGSGGGRPLSRAIRGALRGVRVEILGAIALGGAFGAPARYGLGRLVRVQPDTFPWATFWTNLSGSFALGFVLILVLERFAPSRWYIRPFLATGFLGAYTTYSTFAVETDLLVKNGHAGVAAAYAVASLFAGFSSVWAGMAVARIIPLTLGGRR